MIKKTLYLSLVLIGFSACKETTARKPISYASGEFIKESAKKNKESLAAENKEIENYIKKDSTSKYYQSKVGYWYKYIKANSTDTITPKTGELVDIEFNIQDLNGNVIYTKEETSPKVYIIDKQDIMIGLRHAIKQMRKEETMLFVFPSHMGYGFSGDKNKIQNDQPIAVEITLKNIKQNH